jgi:hypothetical protein
MVFRLPAMHSSGSSVASSLVVSRMVSISARSVHFAGGEIVAHPLHGRPLRRPGVGGLLAPMHQELDQQRVGERHGARLGRAEPAAVDAADHQHRQASAKMPPTKARQASAA